MLLNGTDGEAKEKILSVLGFTGKDEVAVNEYMKYITGQLSAVDPMVRMLFADALFVSKTSGIKKAFADIVYDNYGAAAEILDFRDEAKSVKRINDWCRNKTGGAIGKIIEKIKEETCAIIVNASVFKGTWTSKFDKATSPASFTRLDGTESEVQMMHLKGSMGYSVNKDYRIVRLPYGNGAFEMDVLLPQIPASAFDLISTLDYPTFTALCSSGDMINVDLYLPKFVSEDCSCIDETMKGMGLDVLFSGADFTRIHDLADRIDSVMQSTRIEVDESGTQAASSVAVPVHLYTFSGSHEGNVIPFNANHSFVYIIREVSTSAILYMGVYDGE